MFFKLFMSKFSYKFSFLWHQCQEQFVEFCGLIQSHSGHYSTTFPDNNAINKLTSLQLLFKVRKFRVKKVSRIGKTRNFCISQEKTFVDGLFFQIFWRKKILERKIKTNFWFIYPFFSFFNQFLQVQGSFFSACCLFLETFRYF